MSFYDDSLDLSLYELAVGVEDAVALARAGLQGELLLAVAEDALAALAGGDLHFAQLAFSPLQVEAEVAACLQAAYGAFTPGIGQGGKQVDESGMALQQHLRHTGRAAKVAVNLEGWVRVPEVIYRAVLQQVAVEHVGMVAIVQTGPLVELPAHAPARSAIAAMLEHDA